MAKSAVDSYTKWFAVELGKRYGDMIRMNAIAPGFFSYRTKQNLTYKWQRNNDGARKPGNKKYTVSIVLVNLES
jgi:NAD(P)-dependent dehydrogenase (short-subunit alcohol dehydrogenase family)